MENADGIATLTALGNNQWKVTRTGANAGFVKLKTKNLKGYSVEKGIDVGARFNISARPIVNLGQTYTYTVDASLGNVSFFVGGATVLSTTANTVRAKVLNFHIKALTSRAIDLPITLSTIEMENERIVYPTISFRLLYAKK
ncbi:hypothetical protein [Sphingobacterium sp. HMA12]|uniref:hypothetical protein n=1 Tax=Sphingobacterium sp. HMA12 TaxID=2050894 RepID=UPI000CEA10BD|nr:hypothetical protein [Sphingobacterium sp. HMA12]